MPALAVIFALGSRSDGNIIRQRVPASAADIVKTGHPAPAAWSNLWQTNRIPWLYSDFDLALSLLHGVAAEHGRREPEPQHMRKEKTFREGQFWLDGATVDVSSFYYACLTTSFLSGFLPRIR